MHKQWSIQVKYPSTQQFESERVVCVFLFYTALIVYTIHAIEGLNAHLPCHFQPSTQVKKNAMWFKDVDRDETTRLDQQEGSVGYADRLSLLYPLDQDQTVILRDIVLGDAGIYHCESADGKKLSTVYLTVKGGFSSLHHRCVFGTITE